MKTNYQSINKFDVAVMSMIMVGFVLIGGVLFTGLTPRSQTQVAQSFNMFDIHDQVSETVRNTSDVMEFVMDVPNEFYNQFYIAFTEVATLPSETFEVPAQIASEISRNMTVAINNLSDQVVNGYLAENDVQIQQAGTIDQGTQVAMQGKVLGVAIEASDAITNNELFTPPVVSYSPMMEPVNTWVLPYHYRAPDVESMKQSLTKLINP